nr:multiple epidermal growth factor-like domains protein 10 isoform X2 [Anas platyrhynchos]
MRLASEDECLLCPAGWFCVGGVHVPSGMCSSGHYCPQGTRRSTQYPCPAGTYSTRLGNGRVEDCAACPAGAFCTRGTSKPVLCPVGTYCMEHGAKVAADCVPCPGGYYCPELGTVTPRTCGAGNFSGLPAKPCPSGTYGEQKGLSSAEECLLCPAGKHCYRAGMEPPGIPHPTGDCPPGCNCPPGTGFPFSFPCAPGFFWDNSSAEGEDRCKPCPAGSYCDPPAMSEPKACPAGFHCGEGSSKPEPCPEGTYSNKKGLSGPAECSPCGRGFYCAAPGQTGPSGPCQAGFFCQGRALTPLPTDGVTGNMCPPGAYCPPVSPLPIPCPPGTYSNRSGLRNLRQCLDCPPGLYCDGTNSQAPSGPCEPGYFCTGGAKSALQQMVMEGHYSLTGAVRPEPCPLGSFQPGHGQAVCRDWPEGTFCNETGLAEAQPCPKDNLSGQDAPGGPCAQGYYCMGRTKTAKPEDGVTGDICPRGHFCPAGSAAPSPCPSGEYSNATGMFCGDWGLSSPSGPCWPGFFCTAGASVPNPNGATNTSTGGPCPPGHFCPAGTAIPQQCPVGTYSDRLSIGQESSCTACPSGYYCRSAGLTAPSGPCSAGYYCLSGASSPSPPGVWEKGGPCPVSHFCPEGTSYP